MEGGWKKLLVFGTVFLLVEVTHQEGYTRKYILVNNLKSWIKSQSYCRAEYGDLATINDDRVIRAINRMNWRKPFWIGLYDDVDSWKWSLEGEHFYTAGGRDYRQWQADQPDNAGEDEHCVSMMEDSFWRVKSCTLVKMPLICFRDAEADPYVLVTEEKSWFEAQSYCRRHHTDLVSVTSQSENQKVRRRLKGNQTVPEAWIGLRRDSWRWSDGSSYSFTKWGLQPVQVKNSKACASMQNGKWNKWKCDEKLNFLCQKITEVTEPGSISQAERRSLTVKMKLLTNADLKDPTIRHALLQQLKAALGLKGFTDVELLWRNLRAEPQPAERDACGEQIQ